MKEVKWLLALGLICCAAACGEDKPRSSGGDGGEGGDDSTTTTSSKAASTGAGGAGQGGGGQGGAGQGGAGGGMAKACDEQGLVCQDTDPMTNDCQTCATKEGSCGDEFEACGSFKDPMHPCVKLNQCNSGCQMLPMAEQQACVMKCQTDNPQGVMPLNALLMCFLCDECTNSCKPASNNCPP